ncbi:MAG: hypothetical protein IPN57_13750 [Ignavibacteria bacterium]|nr:hypothetical protein [Ignavibacteria bacterium]
METKKDKDFDTVKMMREIRDKINNETMDMSFVELKKYMSERSINNQVVKDKKSDYSKS